MNLATLERRVSALEGEVARLQRGREREHDRDEQKPWREQIRGTFEDGRGYVVAMRLGREYRESLCPSDNKGAE